MNNPLKWGNSALSLNYNKSKSNYHTSINLGYSHSFLQYQQIENEKNDSIVFLDIENTTSSSVKDISAKAIIHFNLGENGNVRFGSELIHHQILPGFLEIIENGITLPSFDNGTYKVMEAAAFVENNWNIGKRLHVKAGLRYAQYWVRESAYASLEPRFSTSFKLSEQGVLQASFSKMSQPLYLLSSSGGGLPNDTWLPITNNLKPQLATQYDVGYKQGFKKLGLELNLGGFYKNMENLITYQEGAVGIFSLSKRWDEQIESNGIGRAYGLEFYLAKKTGRWTGGLGYTLLKSERKFSNINNNTWYPDKYDRRHDIELTSNFQLSKKWSANANFVYSTGIAVTLASAVILTPDGFDRTIFAERNGSRYPSYHRMDVGLKRENTGKKGNKTEWSFGAYNFYAQRNPFYINYIQSSIREGDILNQTTIGYIGKVISRTLFTILPYAKYAVKF